MFVCIAQVVLLVSLTMVSAELGKSSYDEDEWSSTWYLDEPFLLTCDSAKVNATAGDTIEWKTPNGLILTSGFGNENFELRNGSDVINLELLIKKVTPELHGVYICSAYGRGADKPRARKILGLNIHEERYRKKFDKYRDNLIVAVIATAVFVVPLGTSCFVYHFQYMSPEQKARKQKRRLGQPYAANGGDLPMKSAETAGQDGYENPTFSTQM